MKQDLKIIAQEVCKYYDMHIDNLNGRNRKKEYVFCRQVCHYFACLLTKNSLSTIGRNIGNRNHATVLYGKRMILNYMSYDKLLNRDLDKIEPIIKDKLKNIKEEKPKTFLQKVRTVLINFVYLKKITINITFYYERNKT